MSRPLPRGDELRPPDRPPVALIATPCPWTARALELVLCEAKVDPRVARGVDDRALDAETTAADALLLDERAAMVRGETLHALCQRLVVAAGQNLHRPWSVPLLVIVREPVTASQRDALLDAGAWGIAEYPFGAHVWVRQLAVWARASRASVARVEEGLVDPATGLYNLRGVERRAGEVSAAARRRGDVLAAAVFAVDGAADRRSTTPDVAARIADAWRLVGRESDVLGRIGPSDFALVAPGADDAAARAIVRRLVAAALGGASRVALRVGACSTADARWASMSTRDMLAHAASQC